MNVQHTTRPRQTEQGFTLIELMIASIVGLLLLATIGLLYLGSVTQSGARDEQAIVAANARTAMQIIGADLRRAGSRWIRRDAMPAPLGPDQRPLFAEVLTDGTERLIVGSEALPGDSHDCLGDNQFSGGETVQWVSNDYRIGRDSRNAASPLGLRCKNNGLVEGIEDLRLEFGVPDRTSQQLIIKTISQMRAEDWDRVRHVDVCLVSASTGRPLSISRGPTAAALDCVGRTLPADGRVRYVSRTRVALRTRNADHAGDR